MTPRVRLPGHPRTEDAAGQPCQPAYGKNPGLPRQTAQGRRAPAGPRQASGGYACSPLAMGRP
jgi:hypothetical protein